MSVTVCYCFLKYVRFTCFLPRSSFTFHTFYVISHQVQTNILFLLYYIFYSFIIICVKHKHLVKKALRLEMGVRGSSVDLVYIRLILNSF